jgi:phosphatidylserine decarboxylase
VSILFSTAVSDIRFYNRNTGKIEIEQVYGEKFLEFSYNNPLGKIALHALIKRPIFSSWYGNRMNSEKSRSKIEPFIKQYGLNPDEFEKTPEDFESFNDFFFRKLKPSARTIDPDENVITFPADGRHLGFSKASDISSVFVKGQKFDLAQLLNSEELAKKYAHGTLVLSRLCPVDYHRFHFPISGTPSETKMINGFLFSVSPIALSKNLNYLWQNKRTITHVKTEKIGTVLSLEIGATCVGSIHQTFSPNTPMRKGDEKGYFAFGGSSTITLFEENTVELVSDIKQNSARQIETYAQFGSHLAKIH